MKNRDLIEKREDIAFMLIGQIKRRAICLGVEIPMWARPHIVKEAERLAAKIRASEKFDDRDIDDCIRVCGTVKDEPPLSTLIQWENLPRPTTTSPLSLADQRRWQRYK